MRKQIVAANWKMNLTIQEANRLTDEIFSTAFSLNNNQMVLLGVPFPYLIPIQQKCASQKQVQVCAQNCASTKNGAYTGEVSAEMLQGMVVTYCIIGHSERRAYFNEENKLLAEKVNLALAHQVRPVFCCGEPLSEREAQTQNGFVENQLKESLFHLTSLQMKDFIIAYEPIWAIGTGKTATSDQVQEMHAFIRAVIATQYGVEVAGSISILYGGSVQAGNAKEIFGKPDVDGGLIGGASLNAAAFAQIILSMKN